ncbi:MAG: Zn-ribbon containing protein [Candidatus Pacearchaeota archaeon]
MPHRCVHCGTIYPDASEELLKGCSCGSHFFFYLRDDQVKKAEETPGIEFAQGDKEQIEQDIREIIGIEDENTPVVLDLESVRVVSPGIFEIDLVNLFNKKMPLIYKLEEGKYIIDLASSFRDLKDKNSDFESKGFK